MANIVRKNISIVESSQPVLGPNGRVLSEGIEGSSYDPHKNYWLIVKGCPPITQAPTEATGTCPPPESTRSPWYDNYPPGYSFCYYCQEGETFFGHPDCDCCQDITDGGSNTEVAKNSVNRKILRGELNPIDFGEDGDPETHLYGRNSVAGTTDCYLYTSGDIWTKQTEDYQGNVVGSIPDCYPNSHPNQGCPVPIGGCFRWRAGTPACIVDRLLDYTTPNARLNRNTYYCYTCGTPSPPPFTPNGSAVNNYVFPQAGYQLGNPLPVITNPTGSLCTDCNPQDDGNFHCLHPNDPHHLPPNTCVELTAGTVVSVVNPGPNEEYYATNGFQTFQLSNLNIFGTMLGCEVTCVGGCKTLMSGQTPACNYNVQAAFDDGSCCFSDPCVGCPDSNAINYLPNSCSFNINLCLYPGEGCIDNSVGQSTDINGNATCGPNANQLCQYCNYDPVATISKPCCDVTGCMNDACASQGGYPNIANNLYDCGPNNNLGYIFTNYDSDACCAGYCCNIPGCTDIMAQNHDPNACYDDGSCIYNTLGCTDPAACNYNSNANVDDGSCEFPGCLDPQANNTQGTGIFPATSYDCACNTSSNINYVGQTSPCCDYSGLFGCLDPTALNYQAGSVGCQLPNSNIGVPTYYACCIYPTWKCNSGTTRSQEQIHIDSVGCSSKEYIPPETFTPETVYGVTWGGSTLAWIAKNHPTRPFSDFYYLDYWNTGPGYGGTQYVVPGLTCMSAVTHTLSVPYVSPQMPCPGGPGTTCLKGFRTLTYLSFDSSNGGIVGTFPNTAMNPVSNSIYTWSTPIPNSQLFTSITNYATPQTLVSLYPYWKVNTSQQSWKSIIDRICNVYKDYYDIGNTLYRIDAGGCLPCPQGLTPQQYSNLGCTEDPTCGKLYQRCPNIIPPTGSDGPCSDRPKPTCCCEQDLTVESKIPKCVPNTTVSLVMSTDPCQCPPGMIEVDCYTSQYIDRTGKCPLTINNSPADALCFMYATCPNYVDPSYFTSYVTANNGQTPPGRWTELSLWYPSSIDCDCITSFSPLECEPQPNQLHFSSETSCLIGCGGGCKDPLANNYDPISVVPCGPQDGTGLWAVDNDCCTYDPSWYCHTNGNYCFQAPPTATPGPFSSLTQCNLALASGNC